MAFPLLHLKEVGVCGYPAAVSVRATSAPAPAAAPAPAPEATSAASASTAAGKKEKGSKKGSGSQDVAPAMPTEGPPAEKTKAELDKMSKEDRKSYWDAKRYWDAKLAAERSAGAGDNATSAKSAKVTKQERREMQEAQRKAKADRANTAKEGDELFEELKLQGLTEDQAREVMREMLEQGGEPIEEEDDDAGEVEDLLGSVRRWMGEQLETLPEDALRDFNMKVRFQGHVDSTPPDHLDAILQVLVGQACSNCDWSAKNLHTQVSKALQPLLERWAVLLRPMYGKIADVLDAFNALTCGIAKSLDASGAPEASKESAVVGCLMAVREIDDLVEDEDLLVGCKAEKIRGRVMDQFIEFLESCLDDDDDEEDDEDDE